jgi:hypothetical protein
MGCSDIDVENFRVTGTWADGLHFNACRHIHVNGVTGIETGDDTLSFVTYQDDNAISAYSGAPGSYARTDFEEWNSNGSTAINTKGEASSKHPATKHCALCAFLLAKLKGPGDSSAGQSRARVRL